MRRARTCGPTCLHISEELTMQVLKGKGAVVTGAPVRDRQSDRDGVHRGRQQRPAL